jgi:hypothetical protein
VRVTHAIAFLLGVIATFLAVLVFKPMEVTWAQASSGGGQLVAVSNGGNPGGRDMLWLVDSKEKRLLVYELAEQEHLYLRAARDIQYDWQLDQFPTAAGRHTPSVTEVFKLTEPKRKQAQPPGKPGG